MLVPDLRHELWYKMLLVVMNIEKMRPDFCMGHRRNFRVSKFLHEWLAVLTAAKNASRYDPPRSAIFVTDASYVCNIVRLICSGLWRVILHKLPNCDLVAELAEIWNQELFHVKKVKSHRSFESAVDFNDLWMIAGNYCADLAATSAFKIVPSDIRSAADSIAKHVKEE